VNYGALALLYDRLMAHVGYHRWHALIEQVISQYGRSSRPSILEIGAGTGLLGERMRKAGFRYRGSDLSYAMCLQARQRLGGAVCADGRHLPFKTSHPFDLALFLYDGINYLMDRESYEELFGEVHSLLTTGGLFLFDITTVFNSVNNFSEYMDADDYGDCFYFRHSYYHPLQNMQYNDFTIFSRCDGQGRSKGTEGFGDGQAGLYTKNLEHHEQKVFPVRVVRNFVPESLFETLGVWDDFSFKKHTPHSERVHFLLRKKDMQ
jgi:SAM-dependent methyltransferase